MADMTPAERGAFERLAPTATGQQAVLPVALTAAASDTDLNGTWGGAASAGVTTGRLVKGGAWFSFQASGGVAHFRLKPTAGAPAASATNACIVEDGRTEEFWVTSQTPILDAVGSGVMTLKVWQSSRNSTQIVGA